MKSRDPISALVRPSPRSRSTSTSRRVSCSAARGPDRGFRPRERISAAASSASRRAPRASSSENDRAATSVASAAPAAASTRARREARACRVDAQPEGGKLVDRVAQAWRGIVVCSRGGDGAAREDRHRHHPISAGSLRDLFELEAARSALGEVSGCQPRFHQPREQRSGEQARATDVPDACLEDSGGRVRLSPCEAKRHRRLGRRGIVLEPVEELGGLLEAALDDPQLREPCRRVDAAQPVARCRSGPGAPPRARAPPRRRVRPPRAPRRSTSCRTQAVGGGRTSARTTPSRWSIRPAARRRPRARRREAACSTRPQTSRARPAPRSWPPPSPRRGTSFPRPRVRPIPPRARARRELGARDRHRAPAPRRPVPSGRRRRPRGARSNAPRARDRASPRPSQARRSPGAARRARTSHSPRPGCPRRLRTRVRATARSGPRDAAHPRAESLRTPAHAAQPLRAGHAATTALGRGRRAPRDRPRPRRPPRARGALRPSRPRRERSVRRRDDPRQAPQTCCDSDMLLRHARVRAAA